MQEDIHYPGHIPIAPPVLNFLARMGLVVCVVQEAVSDTRWEETA